MKYRISFILLATLFSFSAQAQNYSFKKTPEWVKTINFRNDSSISKYDALSGYYFSLVDYQANLEDEAYFNHEVINVVSYSGITQASQLSVSYDTSYQQLIFHHLYIWRNGEKIDRTNDLKFQTMNNEYKLNEGIYTGKITAYDILSDIRKDDLIDFAYTLKGDNPIFDNEKYLFIPLETINQAALYSVRILFPKEKDYNYKCIHCDSLSYSDTIAGNYRQFEIQTSCIKPVKYEDYMPSWSMPSRYFTLSSFKSWKDVNTWAQRVFALNKEPELKSVFDEIFTGKEPEEEKINKIIDYVQNDIRYMGIESGIGSIKPFPPEQVVKQRFGDCKDKSLLLVSLLKKAGIKKAYPVLVNASMKQKTDKLYPSNEVFNHSIVRFEYNDSIYWVDPTIAMQGGSFKDLSNYDYGKVLIVGMPTDSLQDMSPRKIESGVNLVDELTVKSFTEPVELKMSSTRYGMEADNRRAVLEYYSAQKLSDMVTEELKSIYPTVNKTSEVGITDNSKDDTFTLKYNYEVDGIWQSIDKGTNGATNNFRMFKYQPQSLYQYMKMPACQERKYDYEWFNYPMNLNYSVIFHFPKDMLISDDYHLYDNEYFTLEEKIEQLNSSSFKIDYHFKTKSTIIKAKDFKKICDQKTTIVNSLPEIIIFPK